MQNKLSTEPEIIVLDIETAPNVLTSHSLYEKHGLNLPYQGILQERYIICATWKRLGASGTHSICVKPSPLCPFKADRDYFVVRALHEALSGADAVIAHHGDAFDLPWIHARIAYYQLPPLPPIVQIDTRKIARRKFRFNSNRLDYLGEFLGVGRKIKTDHELWMGCLHGWPESLARMVKYNKGDVHLLERVYNKLAPYVPAKLNARLYSAKAVCPNCGDGPLRGNGMRWKGTQYRRLQCGSCGGWCKQNPKTGAIHGAT